MKVLDFECIKSLDIPPKTCIEWVKEAFLQKSTATLPAKISIKLPGQVFFNTMPCYIPSLDRFGVKEVSRFPIKQPSLSSEMLLYDASNGTLLALMDATWITAMRTGAVAALSANLLKRSDATRYAFIGLGNTARATLLCLAELYPNTRLEVHLLRYKNQAALFIERFKGYDNIHFQVFNSVEELLATSETLISCVTSAEELFAPDDAYPEGILVIPVHTRGFQNCDLFFDKVFADDRAHVEGFRYFNRFKSFAEVPDVLAGKCPGRTSDTERILAYNIGIALHDVYFASRIYDMALARQLGAECSLHEPTDKFWI